MRTPAFAAAILLAAVSPVAFADYTTTILTPPTSLGALAFTISGNQQGGYAIETDGSQHAYYWTGAAASGVDYDGTYASSFIFAVSPTLVSGYVADASTIAQAAVWTPGNPTPQLLSATNANDSYTSTIGYAVSGSITVGAGNSANAGQTHALIWTNPSADPTDLHNFAGFAPLYTESTAAGTDGTRVVGNAAFTATTAPHAILWNLSNSTFTDLHDSTTNMQSSQAAAISGNQIVGYGMSDGGPTNALLWTLSGTDDATINFTTLIIPDEYLDARALATNGSLIVGVTTDVNNNFAAVVWTSPTSYELLPTPLGDLSEAIGINADGDIVGTIIDLSTHQQDAVIWSPVLAVPEPASLAMLLPALLLLRRRKPLKS